MKTAFRILARDLKALAKNPIALLVVGALLVLPGLYAWYCIIANWDPYSNTGRVPVAVVNLDEGAKSDVAGEVDVGAQVVEGLRENDNIDWRFYDDEETALLDTRDAICYATIVFPADLSRNIVGILEGSDDPPLVYYYPNEKYNAVATKVTDSAAQTLVRQVNQQFSSTVNETILARVQGAADEAEERASGVKTSAIAEMRSVRKDVAGVLASLDDAASSIEGWRTAAAGAQGTLAGISEQLPVIKKALSRGGADLKTLQEKTDEFGGAFAQGLVDSGTALANLSAETSSAVGTASVDVAAIAGSIDASIAQLETISDSLLEDDALKDIRNEIDSTLEKLRSASETVSDAAERASGTVKRMNATVKKATSKSSAASKEFTSAVLPDISSGTSELATALSGLSGAVGQFDPQIGELSSVLSQADSALERATQSIDDAKVLLTDVSEHLSSTVGDLSSLGSALQIEQLKDILDVDPDNLGQFVSSPVQLVTEKIYPVSNYGTAVAPFYTNLALWIGCFILVSLIKVEVDRTGFEEASTQQRYFGRWLLFVILSLLQSQVICGVDILLGIDCVNPAAFMAAGALCSFAYMNLIYALVITFRNVGKTLCILLLIMQVPGSSGMYPIQMMPGFFQFIHPALPFTYGIDAMREALCGMYGNAYLADLGAMALIVPASLAVGLALRPYLMNFLVIFDEEMRKTGFFASEEHGQAGDGERMRALFKALASHDAYRDDMEERAWKFNRRYPKLRRAGSVAAFAIPFAFLAALMPVNAVLGEGFAINLKLGLLVAMLVVLLVVLLGLIVLEYAHRTIEQETRMLGEELLSYSTLFDQAEGVRSAVEEQMGELRDELRDAADRRVEELRESVGKHAAVVRGKASHAEGEAPAAGSPQRTGGKRRGTHAAPNAGQLHGLKGAARAGAHAAPESASPAAVRPVRAKRKRRHGVAGYIFRTDMRLGFQSVIGVVVIMLLVITPSLYAWFNIAGSWDPYGNTNGLKVGVANVDEGYKGDIVPVRVNVGDTVVSQLRGNSSFDWVFDSEEACVEGVRSGEYYAAIVIPQDFSRNLMTYLVDDTSYPDVVYYTNEKENPIAPIITQKGASSIQESIRASFTQRIDEVVLTVGQDLVGYATQPRVSGYAAKMSGHLDDATHDMGTGATELESLSDLSKTVSGVIETAGTALDGVHEAGQSAKGAVSTAKSGAKRALAAFDEAAALVKDLAPDGDDDLDSFKSDIDYALQLMQEGSANAPGVLSGAAEKVGDWVDLLEILDEGLGDLEALIDDADDAGDAESGESADSEGSANPEATAGDGSGFSFDPLIKALKRLKTAMETAASHSSGTSGSIADAREDISALFDEAQQAVSDARSFYGESVQPAADDLKGTMAQVSDSAGSVVEGIEDMVTGLSGSTDGLSSQLDSLSGGLSGSGGKLKSAAKRITDAKQRLADALESGDAKKLAQVLLGNDTTLMSQRLAEPVQQDRQAMYAVSNYGSSMAPFYTVLSLWVGALVMVSTMRAHVEEERAEELRRRFAKVRPRHEYFGRYGIFGFISLLQSLLVLLGDMFFLNIQCVHPVLFLLLGVFVGQVFCLIVYTLTELFGDVGKAVCVILLIMQVAASGGTFPVEMLDPLLSSLVPFLPFYHAMSLLQECVAGMNVLMAAINVVALLVTIGGMLLIGVVVRRPFRKLNDFFEAQLEKTGYM